MIFYVGVFGRTRNLKWNVESFSLHVFLSLNRSSTLLRQACIELCGKCWASTVGTTWGQNILNASSAKRSSRRGLTMCCSSLTWVVKATSQLFWHTGDLKGHISLLCTLHNAFICTAKPLLKCCKCKGLVMRKQQIKALCSLSKTTFIIYFSTAI